VSELITVLQLRGRAAILRSAVPLQCPSSVDRRSAVPTQAEAPWASRE